jgi:hypothetical protein
LDLGAQDEGAAELKLVPASQLFNDEVQGFQKDLVDDFRVNFGALAQFFNKGFLGDGGFICFPHGDSCLEEQIKEQNNRRDEDSKGFENETLGSVV